MFLLEDSYLGCIILSSECYSLHLSFGEGDLSQGLARTLDVAPQGSEGQHAAIKATVALIAEDAAHVEELLLVVDVLAHGDMLKLLLGGVIRR